MDGGPFAVDWKNDSSRRMDVMLEKELTAANGYTYRVQVNEADAEKYGLKPRKRAENKKGAEPENKSGDEGEKPRRPGAARRREQ